MIKIETTVTVNGRVVTAEGVMKDACSLALKTFRSLAHFLGLCRGN